MKKNKDEQQKQEEEGRGPIFIEKPQLLYHKEGAEHTCLCTQARRSQACPRTGGKRLEGGTWGCPRLPQAHNPSTHYPAIKETKTRTNDQPSHCHLYCPHPVMNTEPLRCPPGWASFRENCYLMTWYLAWHWTFTAAPAIPICRLNCPVLRALCFLCLGVKESWIERRSQG